jgi:flagellar biosynthesis/type III secretory pathway protein FliH
MALSKSTPSAPQAEFKADWTTDPLLSNPKQVPRFLRTQWDEKSAKPFGPWRSSEKMDPSTHLMEPEEVTDLENEVANNLPEPQKDEALDEDSTVEFPNDLTRSSDPENPAGSIQNATSVTDANLKAIQQQAYLQGFKDGMNKAIADHAEENQRENELVRHVLIELRSISQDPQRFFEPLKRLSLHLAEQLVRAELQLSGQAIHNLIQQCIQQLDHAVEPVHVSVNPEDMQRLTAMGESVTKHMQLEADAQLRPGSVRVRVQDSVVQDLIETRLEPLARRLLAQPEQWMQQSSLVKDRAEALPADAPVRDWQRQVVDVEDTEIKPAANPEKDAP